MVDAPKVSVLLPVRDGSATLAEAIASIRAQTIQDWELLILDDGSADGSQAIAEEHAAVDPRIRVIVSKPVGLVRALARLAFEARAPFLARMDADDVAAPARLERQWRHMQVATAAAVCGTQVTVAGTPARLGRVRYIDWINRLITPDAIERELFVECPLPHPTFFMRRDAFEAVGGYREGPWPEDYDLVFRFWQAGWELHKVAEPLLAWRESPTRLSMTDPRYSEAAFRQLKRRALRETYLKGRRPFLQWGAGEVGKRWLREWGSRAPDAVIDIRPGKLGQRIHRFRVIPPDAVPAPGDRFIAIAVGTPGARDEIRRWLEPRGHRELRDYLFLA